MKKRYGWHRVKPVGKCYIITKVLHNNYKKYALLRKNSIKTVTKLCKELDLTRNEGYYIISLYLLTISQEVSLAQRNF